MSLPIVDLSLPTGRRRLDELLNRLRFTASASSDAAAVVARVIEDVRAEGDEAVVRYMRRWTDPSFSVERIRVRQSELDAAERAMPARLRDAIERAIDHVRAYQRHVMPSDPGTITLDGCELGMRFSPVASCGLTVPGGTAVLFSSLLMLAVPAQVAGVPSERISVVSPPPTRRAEDTGPVGDISPLVLATCRLLGVERVYRIGGAQAVAALALGTGSVEPVDLIAGPGNVYVQLAKQQLAGLVGSDNGFYGPSEIVTLADATADAGRVASDLVAQAEHDPGKCFLIAWDRGVLEAIVQEVDRQKVERRRLRAIDAALGGESAAVLARDEAQAAEVADRIAAEHVNLAVADPRAWLDRLRHGGEFFLGDGTPVAAGDYYAGPSHCLPTGTTARFSSGVSVYTFLRRSGTVSYPARAPMSDRTIEDIARMAEAEGLDGHAESVRRRR